MTATAAIYYHPEAYTTSGPKLMGRNAAGESFLRGFLSYSRSDHLWVQVQNPAHVQHFQSAAQRYGNKATIEAFDHRSLATLAKPGVVYHPGPGLGEHAHQRAAFGHQHWSLCGITHTTCSAGAMDSLSQLITAPIKPWDALICTSQAVKDNVTRLLQAQVDYLVDRLGITRVVMPQMPVIPLGIHTRDFEFSAAARHQARVSLNADDQTLVVLFTGRLSFHAKSHPLAMYQALQQASLQTGKQVLLVECGWHANAHIEKAYRDAAEMVAPNIRTLTLDGRIAEDRERAWASADIFCSLSDNIQETFGIVPIEAMAAGLPVIVSDWDGYKDTVRDGIDGFRIPTVMPEGGLGGDLATRHALGIDTYDMYCGYTSSLVAVDIERAAHAFVRLFESPELRKRMGDAGRERARHHYDWARIIPAYESLWAELNAIRQKASSQHQALAVPWPARMDPFKAFASYPTGTLKPETPMDLVGPVQIALEKALKLKALAMVDYAREILPTDDEIRLVLLAAESGPGRADGLVAGIDSTRQLVVFRSLTWFIKLGVLKISG